MNGNSFWTEIPFLNGYFERTSLRPTAQPSSFLFSLQRVGQYLQPYKEFNLKRPIEHFHLPTTSSHIIHSSITMKTATAISILATVITTSEGKKSKTSNDFYNSKDGDRFAAKWEPGHDEPSHDDWWGAPSHDDHDDWWAPSSSSHDEWWGSSAKPRSGWNSKSSKSGWSSKSSKPSGSWNGWSGSSGFHCKHKTFYIDLDDILDDNESGSNKFTNSYHNYRAYKSSSDVGNNSYDGIFAYRREHVSELSCQGQGMLGLDGGPIFKDQIYIRYISAPCAIQVSMIPWTRNSSLTGVLLVGSETTQVPRVRWNTRRVVVLASSSFGFVCHMVQNGEVLGEIGNHHHHTMVGIIKSVIVCVIYIIE